MTRKDSPFEYGSWRSMHSRCENPRATGYKNYGGRGIKVCKRWSSFDLFLKDMGRKPTRHHSIHRKDRNLGYTPSNCVWATRRQQLRAQWDAIWDERQAREEEFMKKIEKMNALERKASRVAYRYMAKLLHRAGMNPREASCYFKS